MFLQYWQARGAEKVLSEQGLVAGLYRTESSLRNMIAGDEQFGGPIQVKLWMVRLHIVPWISVAIRKLKCRNG